MNFTERHCNEGAVETTEGKIHIEMMKPLLTQVAGHHNGIFDIGKGLILKAVQNSARGKRELEFYKSIFDVNCRDEISLSLRRFIPAFNGTVVKDGVTFLVMENVCSNFENPSVVDIKMGRVTSEPQSNETHVLEKRPKFRCAEHLGFVLSGMMVYNQNSGSFERVEKEICLAISEEAVLTDGLGKFFGLDQRLRKDAIRALIPKLKDIETWFLAQKSFAFYSSSLLLIYDTPRKADDKIVNVNNHCSEQEEREENVSDPIPVELRLIDFGRVFPASETDSNVLFGIQHLLKSLEKLLEM